MNYYVRVNEETFDDVVKLHKDSFSSIGSAIRDAFNYCESGDVFDVVDGDGKLVGSYEVQIDEDYEKIEDRKLPWSKS